MRAVFLPLPFRQGIPATSPVVGTRRLRDELPSLLVLGLIPAISSLGMAMHVPALNTMGQCFGVDQFAAQSIVSLYMLAFSFAIFASAFLSDVVGKKLVLVTALILSACASLVAACSWCFEVLLLARVCQAFAAGFIVVVPYAIIQEMLSGRALAKSISYVSILHSIAGASAPLVGGCFALGDGWRAAFLAMAVYTLAILFFVCRSVKSIYRKRRKSPQMDELFSRARKLVFQKQFLSCMALLSFSSALYYGFLSIAPVLLISNFKLSEFHCGFALFLLCGFWPVGNKMASIWAEKFGLVRTLHMALLVICVGLMPLCLAQSSCNFILITVAMIPYMIGAGIVSPLVVAAATRSDPGLSGLASSLLFAVQVLVGAFTAWFFGFFDLSNCKDIALFGLAMTMLSYMAIGFLTIPNLRRKAATTI